MSDLSPPPEYKPRLGPLSRHFKCDLRSSGRSATWIRACGELDLGSAPQFERAMREAFSSARLLIVDLRELTFIDSTGMRLMIEADARARSSRRRLVFVAGPPPVDRLFKLLGLSDRLETIDLKPVLVPAPPPAASGPPEAA